MKKYVVFNDVHLYSSHQLEFDPYPDYANKEDIVLIGDIVDLYNCKYKDLSEAQGLKKSLETQFKEKYVTGNHELTFDRLFYIEEVDGRNILFTHGDKFYWDEKKFNKFRSSTPGASTLKRLGAKIWNKLRHLKTEQIADEVFDRVSQYAKENNCHMIVTGHQHPLHVLLKQHNDIMILCLPQGRHDIFLTVVGVQVTCNVGTNFKSVQKDWA